MTSVEQQKLAAEIANQAAAAVAEWSTVPELIEFSYTPSPTASFESDADVKPAKVLYFNDLVAEAGRLKDEIEFRENKLKDIKEALTAAVLVSGKSKVSCIGYRLAMVEKKGSKKILPEKLVAKGVSPEIIAACTVVSAASSYLDIRKSKEKE